MSAAEPAYVAATLAWCNERRAEKGEEPLDRLPKGHRMDSTSCPCGKATGASVGPSSWGWLDDEKGHRLPVEVQEFVAAFDAGQLPQYDEYDEETAA